LNQVNFTKGAIDPFQQWNRLDLAGGGMSIKNLGKGELCMSLVVGQSHWARAGEPVINDVPSIWSVKHQVHCRMIFALFVPRSCLLPCTRPFPPQPSSNRSHTIFFLLPSPTPVSRARLTPGTLAIVKTVTFHASPAAKRATRVTSFATSTFMVMAKA
jgi:hypothetical protein